MPNHITNIIKSSPEVIRALINTDESGKLLIDFGNIIPKPKRLDDVIVDGSEDVVKYLFNENTHKGYMGNGYSFDRFLSSGGLSSYDDKRFESFINMIRNKREYGHTSWYDWSCENWGTKWNAYDYDITEDDIADGVIKFDTAWACPLPVIKELSRKFPNDEIELRYADEDIGHNYGHLFIKNGAILAEGKIFDPILFALTVKGDLDDSPWYQMNPETGKYEYNEEYDN